MKKTLFILAIALCGVGMLFAQKPMTGFLSGGTTSVADASFGMPISGIASSGGHTVVSGLPYAFLKTYKYTETVMGGLDYTDEFFSFTPVTVSDAGVHHTYVKHKAPKGYDWSVYLTLEVLPCGPGVNAVSDAGITYESVPVADYCWTKQNLRDEVTGARVYDDKTDAAFILKYGRLYTWFEAVGVPDGGTPSPDVHGFVKGICPTGWHIPTGVEMEAFRAVPTPTVNATTDWTGPHATENTNATGFTAYPAGFYKAEIERYEGLGTQTDWWSSVFTSNAGLTTVSVTEIAYYCDAPMEKLYNAANGMSVRCVKDHD